MISKKNKLFFCATICCLLMDSVIFGANTENLSMKEQEYKQEQARIKALEKSFTPGPTNDLENYEKFADEIQTKWKGKNKEHYARLMLEVCGPLSSGNFKDDRRHVLARKYALLALQEPDEIPVETELELTGHVITKMIGPNAPKGQEWEQIRRKDVEIRLHAWKRLIDAIDPTWNPNDLPLINVVPPVETGLPAGVLAETIEDPNLRAEYKVALEANQKKNERYSEQNRLHKWLKRYPKYAEEYLIQAYSTAPYNNEEIVKYLNDYKLDEKTKARIIDTVTKNIEIS